MNLFESALRPRIYAGFGVLIMIAFGLTAFATWKLSAVEDSVARLSDEKDSSARAVEIGNRIQIIRRANLSYIVAPDEDSLKEAAAAEAEAIALLEGASAANRSEDRRPTYDRLKADVDALRAKRTMLIGFVNKAQAARAKLHTGGDDLSDKTQKLINSATSLEDNAAATTLAIEIETNTSVVRASNWRFQASRDPSEQATFATAVEHVAAAISSLERRDLPDAARDLIGPVKATLAAFNSSFEFYSSNLLKSTELFWKDMVPLMSDMQRRLALAEASLRQESDRAKTETFGNIAGIVAGQKSISTFALLLGALIAYFVARSIVAPVSAMTSAMLDLAAGNFQVILPGLRRRDEIGQMARAVETFKIKSAEEARLEAQRERARQDRATDEKRALEAKAEAERKATEETAQAERRTATLKLAQEFEATVGHIIDTVTRGSAALEAAASSLTKTASTAQGLSGVVATASDEVSVNVQSVASATDEIACSIHEVGRRVHESDKIAREAVGQAENTNAQVMELSNAAGRIGSVIKLITDIAEKTNLLALNATIEAARAGDAGKGFAVVAQEVKALAAQTAKATGEIDRQISGMQAATRESVRAIQEIGRTIGRISEISSNIAATVEEQGTATQEIAQNIGKAATGTAAVANNIADVNRAASETESGSAQVLSSARSLANQSERLNLEVQKVLSMIRAS
jgi:methyl-accepting chemotaxis protein